MKTNEFRLRITGQGMEDALAATEQLGRDSGLTSKENLRLRLLAEELFGMVRSITEDIEASYFAEAKDKSFTLRLSFNVKMTHELRERLISVSSQGKNAAAKGFMGKIKDMIAVALLPDESGASVMSGISLGVMGLGSNTSPAAQQSAATAIQWSLQKYKNEIEKDREENGESKEAWDELEKSIVASIADEVVVSIVGSDVDITIEKAF